MHNTDIALLKKRAEDAEEKLRRYEEDRAEVDHCLASYERRAGLPQRHETGCHVLRIENLVEHHEERVSVQLQDGGASFFLVWCPTSKAPPNFRHHSAESARAEAERLARANRGGEFFILGAVAVSQAPPDVITRRLGDDSIPF